MDESNHEMVNMLTRQIGTMFNPLIQSTNQSYQALATQMERIVDFFSPVQPGHQQNPQIQNPRPLQIVELVVQGINLCLNPSLSNQWSRHNL